MKLLPCLAAIALVSGTHAATLQSAKVTRVYNDVKIYSPGASAKAARIGNTVSGRTSLQTGRNSRSELQFQDNTLTRIGQNSVFSFQQGSRNLKLDQGTLLLQVPKRAGDARIHTATVTAAITGTTIMMEYHKGKWCKIIVLEGTLDAYLNQMKKGVKIKAGQMLVMPADAVRIPKPIDIDLNRLQKSSALAGTKFFPALPQAAQVRINQTITRQQTMIKSGALTSTNTNTSTNPQRTNSPRAATTATATRDAANSVRVPERDTKWWDRRPRE